MAAAQTARVVLRWKAVPGAKAYELQIARDAACGDVVLEARTTSAGYRWDELPTATHWYRVRSFDAEGRASEWSPVLAITVDSAVPAQVLPEDGAVVPCGGPVSLELAPSALVKTYGVELAPTADFARPRTIEGPSASFPVGELPPGTWWWRARAVDVKGRRAGPGPARSLIVRVTAPRPRPVADVTGGTRQVGLAWAPVACAARWVVELSRDGKERVTLDAAQPALTAEVGPVGDYRWRVAGVDAAGRVGDFSPEQLFRVRLPAPEPRGEVLEGEGAVLSWAPVAGAASYRVELTPERAPAAAVVTVTVTGTSWRTPALKPGRSTWRVTARDAQGRSSLPSKPRAVEPEPPVTLDAPRLLEPRDGEALALDARLELRWEPVPDAAGYELVVDGLEPLRTEATQLAVPAQPAGAHEVKLRARGRGGVSAWVGPLRISWGPPPPVDVAVAQLGLEVRVTLLDAAGQAVDGAAPTLKVTRGALGAVERRDGLWVTAWTPPADGEDVLVIEAGVLRLERPLARPAPSAFVVGVFAGGLFNGGPIASPTGLVAFGYRLPVLRRRLEVELRGGAYRASARFVDGALAVSGSGWLVPLSLLIAWHHPVGAFVARGGVGPGVQLGFITVDGRASVAVAPGVDVVAGLGRRLGPGRVEAELGFAWAPLDTQALRLIAGGFGVRLGYALDF